MINLWRTMVVVTFVACAQLQAQVPAIQMVPAQRVVPAQAVPADAATSRAAAASAAAGGKPVLRDEEKALLKADYEKLSPEEREAMVAAYKDLGIDLLAAVGTPANAASAAAKNDLLKAIRALNFARTADKVLEARAQVGLKSVPMPGASAPVDEQAAWLHRNLLAGEWAALPAFLKERAGNDAPDIYAHVLQSTNQGDPGLLPEEILALSEACPAELTDWQLTLLAQLLKTAAARSSTGPFLAKLREGTTFFGPQEDGRRDRTAKFLSEAGLAVEAYDFLPVIEKAREKSNSQALTAHARYHQARATTLGQCTASRAA